MSERKYSAHEIDDLRSACRHIYLYGKPVYVGGISRTYREADAISAAEQMTRTYMLAGITADDLRSAYSDSQESNTDAKDGEPIRFGVWACG